MNPSLLHELLQLHQHLLLLRRITLKVFSCVDNQNVLSGIVRKPFLMFIVDKLQIFKGDLTLFLSLSLFGSLVALIWSTSQVNHFGLADLYHRLETWV